MTETDASFLVKIGIGTIHNLKYESRTTFIFFAYKVK